MSLLLAQLAWVGSGVACDMNTMGLSGGAGMAGMDMAGEMAGMDMSGMDMAGTTHKKSGGDSEHHHAPCDFPWAPEGCQSMAPCAPIALGSTAGPLETPDALPSVSAAGVLTPPSIKLPPELPPPRA